MFDDTPDDSGSRSHGTNAQTQEACMTRHSFIRLAITLLAALIALALAAGLATIPLDQHEVGRDGAFLEGFVLAGGLSFLGLLIGLAILAFYYRIVEDR